MSYLKVNTINDASGGSNAQLYGVSMRSGGTAWVNRMINGDMRIDQRNAGASVTASSGSTTYPVDRFLAYVETGSSGTFTGQRSTDAPSGFSNSLLLTTATADSSISASEGYTVQQRVEGFNFADLAWGTASAQSVTLSFWVKSSLTGTHAGSITNGSFNRAYVFNYTISSANTWEYKTVTVSGDTSGTWNTSNGIGAIVYFNIGAGSNFQRTAGSWGAFAFASSGAVNVIGTGSATFYITGVQLEAGSVASPFERRDYGRELMMCQRYFYAHATGNGKQISLGSYYNGTQLEGCIPFPVTMRAAPSGVNVSGTDYYVAYRNGGFDYFNSISVYSETSTTCAKWGNASEISGTGGQVANVVTNNAAAYLGFSAEL